MLTAGAGSMSIDVSDIHSHWLQTDLLANRCTLINEAWLWKDMALYVG